MTWDRSLGKPGTWNGLLESMILKFLCGDDVHRSLKTNLI